jgi:hypothetical protein
VVSEQNCVLSFLLSAAPARAVLFLFNVFETNILRESLTSEFSLQPRSIGDIALAARSEMKGRELISPSIEKQAFVLGCCLPPIVTGRNQYRGRIYSLRKLPSPVVLRASLGFAEVLKMKAIRAHAFGGPDVLQLDDVIDPIPGPGEVVIDVRAAGINPADTYMRNGTYAIVPKLPYIPGGDAGGVVSAIGAGVGEFKVGDPVFVGTALSFDLTGCYAEKVKPR